MRMPRLTELIAKDSEVFPMPLIMLINVLLAYKKGQIHARVLIKSPARELSNKNSPIHFQKASKTMQQALPRNTQQ